ncbi:nucleolar protein 12 [Anabrus simplex]|uniref:nucleolar protein 12 n=1 Tax=Anabrus simplex TaxID=316456 RepID=UPI0034DD981B
MEIVSAEHRAGSRSRQKKARKKFAIVFDPQARREFLSGFHKRKLQRKKKAHEELKQQLKDERKRLKQEARESYKKLIVSHRPVPELEHLFTEKYELENHSVSIMELSASELAKKNNWIGENKVQYEQEDDDDEEEDRESDEEKEGNEVPGMVLKTPRDVKKVLKKQATKQVQKSKAFQMKNKLEQRKNKKKSLKVKKLRMKVQSNCKRSKQGKKHRNRH